MRQSTEQRADLNKSGVARYIQLATLFRRRIHSGQWREGAQIPTIEELAAECGVARATIRQAVGLLEAEGLVSRFRAKGTFVQSTRPERIWCDVETDWNGLLRSREGADIEILADTTGPLLTPPPHEVGAISASYRHLRRRHSRNREPFLLADVYIDEKAAAKLPEAACREMTAMKLATSIPGVKIMDARQTLTIGAADIETAGLLNIELNAPVCFVDRSAVDQRGKLILFAKGIYRGDVVRIDVKLR